MSVRELAAAKVMRTITLILSAACVLAAAQPLRSQGFRWPERPKNLKVLADSVRGDALGAVMRGFAFALGVDCGHCHVGEGDLTNYDFAADDKQAKAKARVMLRMVQAINGSHLSELENLGVPAHQRIPVTCTTCHRGVARPIPLDVLLEQIVDSVNADAALARYAQLRQEYFGSSAYDFSRGSLTTLAERLIRRQKFVDAVKIMELELATTGEDVRTLLILGGAQAQAGEREKGLHSMRRALELAPESAKPMIQRQIDRLSRP